MAFVPPILGIPFTRTEDMIQCCTALTKAGFAASGREQLYSGVSGEPLDGLAFVGCVQYQRLRHMVVAMGVGSPKKTTCPLTKNTSQRNSADDPMIHAPTNSMPAPSGP